MIIKKLHTEGLSIENDRVVICNTQDSENDLMNLLSTDIYESDFLDNTYYFGYKFNSNASRKDRTTIIKWLKGLGTDNIDDITLRQFIRKPLITLNKRTNITTFDLIIYPRSERSNLVKIIINELNKLTSHNTQRKSFELVKSLPNAISFDWEMFNANYEGEIGDHQYNQIRDYIENTLIPKIQDLSYFSIADNVKYKYRSYIQNYLQYETKEQENLIKSIENGKILIVDDINTSGSTLMEILRIVNSINNNCEIYIFTLIGKD